MVSRQKTYFFLQDLKFNCADSEVRPSKCDSFFIQKPRYDMKITGLVDLELDRVTKVEKVSGFPWLRINDTEDLIRRSGEANIYSTSTDFETRSYSYVDRPWTFQFEKDQLRRV